MGMQGYAPTLAFGLLTNAGQATLAGTIPALQHDTPSFPLVGSLSVSGITASLITGDILTPDASALQAIGRTPFIETQGSIFITTGELSIAFQGVVPQLVEGTIMTPGTADLVSVGLAPRTDYGLISIAGTLDVSGIAPTAKEDLTITVPEGSATVAGEIPVIGTGFHLIPESGSMILSGQNAEFLGRINPDSGSLSLVGYAPDIPLAEKRVHPKQIEHVDRMARSRPVWRGRR